MDFNQRQEAQTLGAEDSRIPEGISIPSVPKNLFPQEYELLPGVNHIYELELAIAEFNSLSKQELVKRGAYFWLVDGEETYHHRLCSGGPLQVDKNSSTSRRAFFEVYRYKTGYAAHGLFPYRGKFHPQLIKAIMNIMRLREGDTVLDPMMGSGTTNIEASVIGLNSIGVEMSPFCCLMTRAKRDALGIDPEDLRDCVRDPEEVFEFFFQRRPVHLDVTTQTFLSKPQDDTSPPNFVKNENIRNILELAYLDAVGYARRIKTRDARKLFPIVLDRYFQAIENFANTRKDLGIKLGQIRIAEGDARDLNHLSGDIDHINDREVAGIITSPPYSFAIDYLEGDQPQLEYMGYDVEQLRQKMIGLRGSDLKIKVNNYLKDMDKVAEEISRVLDAKRFCVIVIGSNTAQLQRALDGMGIKLEDELVKICEEHHLPLVRKFIRPIEGIRNIMRTESVLFFQKS